MFSGIEALPTQLDVGRMTADLCKSQNANEVAEETHRSLGPNKNYFYLFKILLMTRLSPDHLDETSDELFASDGFG